MRKTDFIPVAVSQARPVFGQDKPWLAPLAGYSDLPFRLLCRSYGAQVCCTEMISARGLQHDNPATGRLLQNTAEDSPLVVQLFGSEPAEMGWAVNQLAEKGFLYFDCNMGCSVRKVMRQGAGAALLADPRRALAIAREMLKTVKSHSGQGMAGFKLRLGMDRDHCVLPELALALEDAGASWLTVHPRYASQGFAGDADWSVLRKLADRLSIPLLASGDLLTAEDGIGCLRSTGANGAMYARGALKNPAIFQNHQELLATGKATPFTPGGMRRLIELHLALIEKHGDQRAALLRMRTVAPRYAHSLPGAASLRRDLCNCDDWATLRLILDKFTAEADGCM